MAHEVRDGETDERREITLRNGKPVPDDEDEEDIDKGELVNANDKLDNGMKWPDDDEDDAEP